MHIFHVNLKGELKAIFDNVLWIIVLRTYKSIIELNRKLHKAKNKPNIL